nr:copia protein [Tanacetum cinerariifolium]
MPLLEEKRSHCQKDFTSINVKKKLPVKDGSYAKSPKTQFRSVFGISQGFSFYHSLRLLRVTLVDLPKDKWANGNKWVFRNKKDKRGIVIKNKARLVAQGHNQEKGIDYDEVFAPVARIESIRLFMVYASFKDFVVYQIYVKSAFLYEKIEDEVYICQPPGFEDPDYPNKVYKVEKALCRLHQAPRACQDKYVADILKNFGFSNVKTASTPMEPNKALVKDAEAEDVDVHLYRSMIGSLKYLTASKPNITFVVCVCARFQVTLKTSHLHAVKGIFRYLRANSTTEAEYVAAASCCGQVLLIQNQMLDYGFNLKKTKIYIDNEITKISQSSGPTNLVANETVYKEWKDRMERAATTASSYEAKQDSGAKLPYWGVQKLKLGLRLHLNSPMIHPSQETTTKVKKVNDQEQIQALVDKQKVIITEKSIRRDLKFDDAEEVGKGLGLYTNSHHTPIDTQPSSSKPQKKIKPERKHRQAAEVHSRSSEIPVEESVPTSSNDPLPNAKEIAKLKKRVKKLEKKRKSRPAGLRRLKKVGTSKQVESSEEKDSLGTQEDASKQGRNIKDIDQDAEISLVDEAQGRMHDAEMFGVDDLEGNEVFVDVRKRKLLKKNAAPTTATTIDVDDKLTLVKTLIAIKASNPKVISTAITTPRAKGVVFHEQVQKHKPTVSSSKKKGKAKMIEPEKPLKKKDQIALYEEVARKLEAEMRAEMEEEERIAREKDEANIVVIEE